MNPIDLNGIWEGFYEYGETCGKFLQGRRTNFTITLQEQDGEFSGVCIDEDKSAEGIEATIKGFIQGDMISFIKKYPAHLFIDEMGKRIVDECSEHPEIEYTGYYSQENKTFKGEWEMTTRTVIVSIDGRKTLGEYYDSGTWQIRKKSRINTSF